MSKSYTPKYAMEIKDKNGWDFLSWQVSPKNNHPGHGKANNKNLEKRVYSYAKSLEIGGVNEGISKMLGYIPYPTEARIINQHTGEVVATWKAAMFQVW